MWWCWLLPLSHNKTFIQTHQNMGCDILYHKWICFKEIIWMIDHIVVISWDMQLLQYLFSNGSHINILLSTYTIMFGLMNIFLIYPYNTSTIQVIYYFKNILKIMFIIHTSSTWFYVNLILHPLHFVIQQLSHIILSYLPLEIKLVLI